MVAANVSQWPGSAVVRLWLWIMLVGSFGMILLRPYVLDPGGAYDADRVAAR